MAKSRSNHSTATKSVGSSNHSKSTSQSTALQKKKSTKKKTGKTTKKNGNNNATTRKQRQEEPMQGRNPNLDRNPPIPRAPSQDRPPPVRRPPPRSKSDDQVLRPMARGGPRNLQEKPMRGRNPNLDQNPPIPRAPSQDRPPPVRRPPPRSKSDDQVLRPMAQGGPRNLQEEPMRGRNPNLDRYPPPSRGPSQDRPPPLRRPPPRSKSDDRVLRTMSRGTPRNLPPLPSQHQRGRGRSISPSQQRRPGPRPRSLDPVFRNTDRSRSNHQAMSRSEHFTPRHNLSYGGRGPPPPHLRRGPPGERSGHSRSGHSTIINSQHSRASVMNSRHSRAGRGPTGRRRDPSNDSRMSTVSRHSRMSHHSHDSQRSRPSLADQKQARRRGQRMYNSLRDVSRGEFNKGKCCCSYVIPVAVLVAAAVGLLLTTGSGGTEPVELAPPTDAPANYGFEDPFEGASVPQWPTDGSGLDVIIVNAMSDEWANIFQSVAEDWEFGNPDAVAVIVQDSGHDKDCKADAGTIKVCNGDYGATKWMGLTDHEVDSNGNIIASTVRINDYYLSGTGRSLRHYTLCHEVGHALGLEHTKEDTKNDYLGGCMGYTKNVAANKHPYRISYETLFQLYGPAATSRRLHQTSTGRVDGKGET